MTRVRLLAVPLCAFACAIFSGPAHAAPPSPSVSLAAPVDPLGRPPPRAITQAQLDVLNRLVDATPDADPDKADLLFRRAELSIEESRHYAEANDEVKRAKWQLAGLKDYIAITEKFAHYKRLDEVLFYLAYELGQMKREDLARTYMKRLIMDYPKSKFIPDAYLVFGEYYFSTGDIQNALKFYDKVLQYPNSRVWGYARYKTAWCHYNLADYAKAVSLFGELAKSGEPARLRHEARHDLVRAYAQSGGRPDAALPLLREVAGDEAPGPLLRMLADAYHAAGRDADCREVAHDVAALDPGGADLCQ